jgi:enamine deaminase RidA (YjgF/YER057c/UK114 family)
MKTNRVSRSYVYAAHESESGPSEYYVLVRTGINKFFEDAIGKVAVDMEPTLRDTGLSAEHLVSSKFFFSDIINQADKLTSAKEFECFTESACSFIGQPPLGGDDLVALLYYIKGDRVRKSMRRHGGTKHALTVAGASYGMHFTANLGDGGANGPYEQTKRVFGSYESMLNDCRMSIKDNAVRTWLYLSDMDSHYEEMARARKDFFETCGLTKETHYLASTGIGAETNVKGALVAMDAIAVSGIDERQISYLSAPGRMSPTHEYGVTFERGAKIAFGDREHFYISGTASIDKNGVVAHPGDIERQTVRAIENFNALLSPHGVAISDMACLVVYLRDMNHFGFVRDILAQRASGPLTLFVNAAVCRASWLVEIEGVGVRPRKSDFPPFL